MNNKFVKLTALLTTLALFLAGCSGSGPTAAASPFTAENDIFSYVPVDTEKRIVTIGKYDSFDEAPLEAVLEAKFPEVDVVFVETLAGPDPFAYLSLIHIWIFLRKSFGRISFISWEQWTLF